MPPTDLSAALFMSTPVPDSALAVGVATAAADGEAGAVDAFASLLENHTNKLNKTSEPVESIDSMSVPNDLSLRLSRVVVPPAGDELPRTAGSPTPAIADPDILLPGDPVGTPVPALALWSLDSPSGNDLPVGRQAEGPDPDGEDAVDRAAGELPPAAILPLASFAPAPGAPTPVPSSVQATIDAVPAGVSRAGTPAATRVPMSSQSQVHGLRDGVVPPPGVLDAAPGPEPERPAAVAMPEPVGATPASRAARDALIPTLTPIAPEKMPMAAALPETAAPASIDLAPGEQRSGGLVVEPGAQRAVSQPASQLSSTLSSADIPDAPANAVPGPPLAPAADVQPVASKPPSSLTAGPPAEASATLSASPGLPAASSSSGAAAEESAMRGVLARAAVARTPAVAPDPAMPAALQAVALPVSIPRAASRAGTGGVTPSTAGTGTVPATAAVPKVLPGEAGQVQRAGEDASEGAGASPRIGIRPDVRTETGTVSDAVPGPVGLRPADAAGVSASALVAPGASGQPAGPLQSHGGQERSLLPGQPEAPPAPAIGQPAISGVEVPGVPVSEPFGVASASRERGAGIGDALATYPAGQATGAIEPVQTAGLHTAGPLAGSRGIEAPVAPPPPGAPLAMLLASATGTLGSELGEKILWLSGHNLRAAEIQLDPPELGPLQIQVHNHRDGTSVQFTTHTAVARDAVESTLPRLRELLEGSGLSLLDVNVSQQQRQGQRQPDAPAAAPALRERLAAAGQVASEPPRRRPAGLVDAYA